MGKTQTAAEIPPPSPLLLRFPGRAPSQQQSNKVEKKKRVFSRPIYQKRNRVDCIWRPRSLRSSFLFVVPRCCPSLPSFANALLTMGLNETRNIQLPIYGHNLVKHRRHTVFVLFCANEHALFFSRLISRMNSFYHNGIPFRVSRSSPSSQDT